MPIQAGQVATPNRLRRGKVAEAVVTTDQSGIGAGPTDLTGLTVTFTTLANHEYKISANLNGVVVTSTSGWQIHVHLDGANIGRVGLVEGASGARMQVTGFKTSSPSAGSHTYKLVATRYTGTGTLTITSAGGIDSTLLVEDITA